MMPMGTSVPEVRKSGMGGTYTKAQPPSLPSPVPGTSKGPASLRQEKADRCVFAFVCAVFLPAHSPPLTKRLSV